MLVLSNINGIYIDTTKFAFVSNLLMDSLIFDFCLHNFLVLTKLRYGSVKVLKVRIRFRTVLNTVKIKLVQNIVLLSTQTLDNLVI